MCGGSVNLQGQLKFISTFIFSSLLVYLEHVLDHCNLDFDIISLFGSYKTLF